MTALLLCLAAVSCGKETPVVKEKEHPYTNRLIHEASPYLLQHAHNPVDWFPWGDEAFEKARREDKPVFLSIGYSTCHWCHVMAHESFENEKIATILNEKFVSIKVDREELPGVDAVYMEFVQKTTGSGGWPMSVFLTADGKPFFGGTYYPPTDSYGRPGFESLLTMIDEAWQNRRDKILSSADEIALLLKDKAKENTPLKLDTDFLGDTAAAIGSLYDPQYGGFGRAPKFPQPSMLSFLLAYSHRTGDKELLAKVQKTLDKMASGGMYDQLGGGFHRYSVDEKWLVPHFEKMLYDQALISRAYLQAYQLTGKDSYKKTVEDILGYVLRDMASPEGAFYSAEDADSEGREGVFYVWTLKEIKAVLNRKEQNLVTAYYGVSQTGNFEHGTSILHIAMPLSEAAKQFGLKPGEAEKILTDAKQKLFEQRAKRIRPHRDEKIIAGWNGMMISVLAYGGAAMDKPDYIQAARKSADFILEHLSADGRLKRYYAKGKAHENAVLDDYAHLVRGLLDLYQADFNPKWLKVSLELSAQMIELFEDPNSGGFYLTGSDADKLFIRTRPDYDGAVPNGNSIAVENLIRLTEFTGDSKWLKHAEKVLVWYQEQLKSQPASLTQMTVSADLWLSPRSEIVIAAPAGISADKILRQIRKRFLPRTVILLRSPELNIPLLEELAETVKDRPAVGGKVTIYLCENFVCKQPIVELDAFVEALEELQ